MLHSNPPNAVFQPDRPHTPETEHPTTHTDDYDYQPLSAPLDPYTVSLLHAHRCHGPNQQHTTNPRLDPSRTQTVNDVLLRPVDKVPETQLDRNQKLHRFVIVPMPNFEFFSVMTALTANGDES